VEEFNKFMQDKGVEEYVQKIWKTQIFDECLESITINIMSISYYICSFISELKDDINPILKIFKPTTLMQAFDKLNGKKKQCFG
jgi:hypothetical protein